VSDDPLIASQRTYYDERADDYGNASKPDRQVPGFPSPELRRSLVDEFRPEGDVLELACGNGDFTAEIVRHARTLTAVDASPRMLDRNQRRLAGANVTYVRADLFTWHPERTYDAVFFGFWLSHVPLASFDRFWALIRAAVGPGGRVGFVDEDERGVSNDTFVADGVARRTLADGRQFDIVKLYWNPQELEDRLRAIGWNTTVRPVGDTFLFGSATPSP
jgi:SAM-dependent methyltransferase